MTHRDITLTEDERTAALLCYLFTCLAFVCREPDGRRDDFYGWITYRGDACNGRTFGDAVLWAMRMEDRDGDVDGASAAKPEGWLSYVEHVVGYRCGPGNGHAEKRGKCER